MNTIQNSNRLVQPVARILRQLLSGFALAPAVRENLNAVRPDVAHGSSRAALGLRSAVKHARNPAHPDRLPASPSRQESTLCPAPPQGAVWRQVSSSHNKERAGEINPLISANSPDHCHSPRRPALVLVDEAGLVAMRGVCEDHPEQRSAQLVANPNSAAPAGQFTPSTALCADATTEQPAAAMRRNSTWWQTRSDEAGRIGRQTSRSRRVHARLPVCVCLTSGRKISGG